MGHALSKKNLSLKLSKCSKRIKYGPKLKKKNSCNAQIWFKKIGPNWSNMVFNSPKLNTMVKIGQNVSELSKYGQKVVKNGPKWSKIIKYF